MLVALDRMVDHRAEVELRHLVDLVLLEQPLMLPVAVVDHDLYYQAIPADVRYKIYVK